MKQLTMTIALAMILSSCGTLKNIWSTPESRLVATGEILSAVKNSLKVLIDNDVITNENDLDNIVHHSRQADIHLQDWKDAIAQDAKNTQVYELLLRRSVEVLQDFDTRYNKEKEKDK